MLLLWFGVFGGCTYSLWQVMQREFDMASGAALFFAVLLTIFLTVGTVMVHKGMSRGYVSGRAAILWISLVVFAVTWVMVFLFNTSTYKHN